MDAIQVYLEDLSISKGGINLKVSRSLIKAEKPTKQSAYVITIGNVVFLHNVFIPLFQSSFFRSKKMLDYLD